jgi:3,4-dihydroxy 2-butanone 4-phosphate synthase/GTP cyclohydrolase II
MIDAKNTESGVSSYDRYLTIKKIVNPSSKEEDFRVPGHTFPLIARDGGLATRQGHTEASVDLCKLGGYKPIAVICEIIKDDGEMARLPDLCDFAEEFNLKISSIEKIQEFLKNG